MTAFGVKASLGTTPPIYKKITVTFVWQDQRGGLASGRG
jgi:hypothetical protein